MLKLKLILIVFSGICFSDPQVALILPENVFSRLKQGEYRALQNQSEKSSDIFEYHGLVKITGRNELYFWGVRIRHDAQKVLSETINYYSVDCKQEKIFRYKIDQYQAVDLTTESVPEQPAVYLEHFCDGDWVLLTE